MADDDDLELGATVRGFAEGQRVFGRYRLERILGRGGMGVVWLAFDEELERRVALKFVPELVCLDKEAIADLKRETRRSLEITHPNIVRIHDFHQDGQAAGISMEYIEGKTLSEFKVERKGCLGVGELGPVVRQLCEALDYAHREAKVVHRDLKPANLMLDSRGRLKITDFGISCSISDSVSRVSMARGTSGTAVFMSPQQMMGERPTPADDIYALGATIYDLLAGKPPFYRGNVLAQVQSAEAAGMAARREELGLVGEPIPEAWEAAVRACLAKDPEARPKSAGEVLSMLETTPNIQHSTSNAQATGAGKPEAKEKAPVGHRPSRMGVAWAGIAAGLLLCAGIGWVLFSKGRVERGERAAAETNRSSEPTVSREAEPEAPMRPLAKDTAPREVVSPAASRETGGVEGPPSDELRDSAKAKPSPELEEGMVAPDAGGAAAVHKEPATTKAGALARGVLCDFARLRCSQMESDAKERRVAVAPVFLELFDLIDKGQLAAATNAFEKIKLGIGLYRGSIQNPDFDIQSYQFVLETGGFLEKFLAWPPDLLALYAGDILKEMPSNAVYFGGTDPGRFVVTAFQALGTKPIYVLSQNPLADYNYVDFARSQYGPDRGDAWKQASLAAHPQEVLVLPGTNEWVRIFGEYLRQSGNPFKPGERVQLKGIEEISAFNSMISHRIFETNRTRGEFFLEESYPMDWYYPHAEPCGLILRLDPKPLPAIGPEVVAQDRRFWDDLSARLLAHPGFLASVDARNAFSKLRSTIANVYRFRAMFPETEYAYRQAMALGPENSETAARLGELLARQGRFDEAVKVLREFRPPDPSDPQVSQMISQMLEWVEARRQASVQKAGLESSVRKGGATGQEHFRLLELCAQLEAWSDFEREVDAIIALPGMERGDFKMTGALCAKHKRADALYRVMRAWLLVDAKNLALQYDLATLAASRGSTNEFKERLERVIGAGGESYRKQAREDARFSPYRALPEFRELLGGE